MNIITYDAQPFGTLAANAAKELAELSAPPSASSRTSSFISNIFSNKVLEKCKEAAVLTDRENDAWELWENMASAGPELKGFIFPLQIVASRLKEDEGYWRPIFYTLVMLTLSYVYHDLQNGGIEGRDGRIDRLSKRQVLGELFVNLEEMSKTQKVRLRRTLEAILKKGSTAVAEETIFILKYYFVDLNGQQHTNYNSATERDKAISAYIDKLCMYYDTYSLARAIQSILSINNNYRVLPEEDNLP